MRAPGRNDGVAFAMTHCTPTSRSSRISGEPIQDRHRLAFAVPSERRETSFDPGGSSQHNQVSGHAPDSLGEQAPIDTGVHPGTGGGDRLPRVESQPKADKLGTQGLGETSESLICAGDEPIVDVEDTDVQRPLAFLANLQPCAKDSPARNEAETKAGTGSTCWTPRLSSVLPEPERKRQAEPQSSKPTGRRSA